MNFYTGFEPELLGSIELVTATMALPRPKEG